MKNNSGVTITSLIIYVIAMIIVIAIIASITSFFYTNVNDLDDNSKNISEITKFNMYFIEEIKKKNNNITKIADDKRSITFSSGNTYTFQDKSIYLNNIRICENVQNAEFIMEENNQKKIVSALITVGFNIEYTKVTQYVLES